ncbi:hypothetical protein G3O06_05590 [Burkholderia sp. Ac-20345]|uniref:hypothetical protein n=1 Tax=Burkholderia sp. Ac-20345 TaxID=2703891 RepID=UPI00197B875B|nr:hypothetical protein [Burkholderia sp. Ac-20345]MBN3777040.1 hypothetical protein [Burkholderia sp. Ac-20345]
MNTVFNTIGSSGLMGRMAVSGYSDGGGLAAVERVPLLLPTKHELDAERGRAQWFDTSGQKGWFMTRGSLYEMLRPYVPTIVAPRWSVARTCVPCWKCYRDTHVYAVCVCAPAGWLYSTPDDLDWAASMPEATRDGRLNVWSMWEALPYAVTSAYLTRVNGSAMQQLQIICPAYRPDTSEAAGGRYWMNHCEHCEAKQGDHFLHGTDHGPGKFLPMSEEASTEIQFREVEGLLIARGSLDYGDAPLEHIAACGSW